MSKFTQITDPFQLNKLDKYQNSSQDLTQSFFQIAQKNSQYQKKRPQQLQNNNSNIQNAEFFQKSISVKKQVELTNQRLEEFNKQQRRTGLCDSEESKLNDLLVLIKENINEIQKGFNQLNQQQSNTDQKTSFQIRKVVVEIIQERLIAQTSQFKKSITYRTEILNNNNQKINEFTRPQKEGITRRSRQPAFMQQQDNQQAQALDIEGGNESMSMLRGDQKHYQQRQESMKNVTAMIKDIAQSFQKLGSIVKLHEVMIDRIDNQTESSLHNVKNARKTLQDTHRKVASSRTLMLKIFMVLFIFATIYIVFLL